MSRRKKIIIKIRAHLNDRDTKRTIHRIDKSRNCFFENIKKIDKPLSRLIKEKKRTQVNKIRNERGEITTDTTGIQRIVRNYYEQIYAKKLDILGEMDKFLETYNLSKLNQEEAENLNRLIRTSKIEAVIKKLPTQRRIHGTSCPVCPHTEAHSLGTHL